MRFRFFLILLAILFGTLPAQANEKPSVTVEKHGWTPEGELVLGFRLRAGSEPLHLGGKAGTGDREVITSFETHIAYLTAPNWEGKHAALPTLPSKPFFGTPRLFHTLRPGRSLVLGVAFAKLPMPPVASRDGQRREYHLVLHVPGFDPAPFIIPALE